MKNYNNKVQETVITLYGIIVDQSKVPKKDADSGLRETSILNESINTA